MSLCSVLEYLVEIRGQIYFGSKFQDSSVLIEKVQWQKQVEVTVHMAVDQEAEWGRSWAQVSFKDTTLENSFL